MVNGYIYCLSNKIYNTTIFKIGFTTKTPERRANELYKTGVPNAFTIEFAKKVQHVQEAEKEIHTKFMKYRINPEREFFDVPLHEVKKAFDMIPGKEWNSTCELNNKRKVAPEEHNIESVSLKQRRLRRKAKCVVLKYY
jgi:hypothetical protein